jgi:hypothetical protein
MRLYLISPRNPLVDLTDVKRRRWNRYRVWKPLGPVAQRAVKPSVLREGIRSQAAL